MASLTRTRRSFLFCLLLISASSAVAMAGMPRAQADEVYTFVVKKQEEKALKRWSLNEWLETRDRMRLMDMWLALHSGSPYEFFLGGAYQLGNLNTGTGFSALELSAAAYASIFGLGFERAGGPDTRYDATFHLRFFGYHYQATHMRFELGVRSESNGAGLSFQNGLAGLGLSIYLAKYFGLEGRWRHAFASTPNSAGLAFSGDQFEGGAFIDFSFLRLYGEYIYETQSFDASNLAAGSVRSGPQIGLRLFF